MKKEGTARAKAIPTPKKSKLRGRSRRPEMRDLLGSSGPCIWFASAAGRLLEESLCSDLWFPKSPSLPPSFLPAISEPLQFTPPDCATLVPPNPIPSLFLASFDSVLLAQATCPPPRYTQCQPYHPRRPTSHPLCRAARHLTHLHPSPDLHIMLLWQWTCRSARQ